MITSVRLKNFKSHFNTEFNFSRGINALVGIMGSGKTSVLQAICFALFGTTPEIKSRKLKITDLIMKRPKPMDEAMVELKFMLGDKEYVVRRVIRRKGTSSAEIRVNGKLLDVGQENVTKAVESATGINFDLFTKAIYSGQNEIDYFLRVEKGKRMEHMDRMLGIEKYKHAREGCVRLRNEIARRHREAVKKFEEMRERDLERKLGEIKGEVEKLNEELKKLSEEKDALERRERELRERISVERERKKRMEELGKRIDVLEARKKEMLRRIEELSKKEFNAEGYEKLKRRISDLENVINEVERKILDGNKKLSEMESRVREMEKALKELSKVEERVEGLKKVVEEERKHFMGMSASDYLKKVESDYEELASKKVKLISRKEGVEKSLKEVERAKDKCPTCGSHLSEERKREIIEEKRGEVEGIDKEIEVVGMEVERKRKELYLTRERVRKVEALLSELKLLEEESRKLKGEVEELPSIKGLRERTEAQVKELNDKKSVLREEKSKLEKRLMELEKVKSDVERAERDKIVVSDMEKAIERMKRELEEERKARGEHDLESLTESHLNVSKKLEAARERLFGIENMVKEKMRRKEEIERDVELMKSYEEEVLKSEQAVKFLDGMISSLESTQVELRNYIINRINAIMSAIWSDITPYANFSSISLDASEDYTLKLLSSNGWVSVEHASGGERSVAALVLRIAFSLAFAENLRWLILDEPTHNLDENAIRKLSEFLEERICDFVEQVFLITHEKQLVDSLTGSIYELYRDKGTDEPTRFRKL